MDNIDPETGIRNGVIPMRALESYFANETFFQNAVDTELENVLEEISDAFDTIRDYSTNCDPGVDSRIDYLEERVKEGVSANWYSDETPLRYEQNGYIIIADGDRVNFFVIKSPYITAGPLCSPCAPNAVYLEDVDGIEGYVAYCLPDEFFPDGKAPYRYLKLEDHPNYKKMFRILM